MVWWAKCFICKSEWFALQAQSPKHFGINHFTEITVAALKVGCVLIPLVTSDITAGSSCCLTSPPSVSPLPSCLYTSTSDPLSSFSATFISNWPLPAEWPCSPHLQMMQMMWLGAGGCGVHGAGGLELMQSDVSPHHERRAEAGPHFPRTGLFLFAAVHADNLPGCSGGLSQGLGSRGVGK